MELKDILMIIDDFFDGKQDEINTFVKQFGKEGNRDIDTREKSMLLTLPIGYRKKLKDKFVKCVEDVE